jgi:hypothetical protein
MREPPAGLAAFDGDTLFDVVCGGIDHAEIQE